MGVLRVDNSRLTSVATCDTQAVLQYVHGYQAKDEPAPRMGGNVGHESLAHYFNTGDATAALKVFWDNYKPFSDQHQVEDRFICILAKDALDIATYAYGTDELLQLKYQMDRKED